jgi:ribulose-5-phosphate 4-epimerase/fuculose-1-phosphate aldolase
MTTPSAAAPGHYDEGVIKFTADHQSTELAPRLYGETCARLIAWREILFQTGLVGQDPARYGGAGYGNVSGRVGGLPGNPGARAFLVTGTQTGGRPCMALADFCVVQEYDDERNWVRSQGPIRPSSESMTHGAIYDLSPVIRFVLHAHCPVIWKQARALRIPETDARVPYGTPEMAREVKRLYRSTALPDLRIFSMAGHEDGIIVFGRTVEEAGEVMIRYLARAYERICADSLSLCSTSRMDESDRAARTK